MLAEKDKQLADMQRVIDLIIASNGPPPPPPGGGETTTGKNVPFGKMVASTGTRLVPAVKTWFPEGGHVPTAAQRVIMACYPPLREQDLDIIESMRRSDHESKTMKGSFDMLGPFSNGLKETDPQWQDYFRIFINYVADGNGAITYGAMIKVLRGSEMYTADITRVLQSEWDAESHYPDESMRPWHLRRCDLSNYDTAHKILCAVCIYLCEKYHRFETLAHIMSKLAEIVLTTNDWAGLPEMFNAQAVLYRRLSAVDRAACKLMPYVIAGISQCPGGITNALVMGQLFETSYSSELNKWATEHPGREATEIEVLSTTVADTYNKWRSRQALIPKPLKPTKLAIKAARLAALQEAEEDSDNDAPSQTSLINAIDIDAMSPAELQQFSLKVAAGNFRPSGGGGGGKDRGRGWGKDKDKEKRFNDPDMEGRCYSCGQKDHVLKDCLYLDPSKRNKAGSPLLDFAKICACKPPLKTELLKCLFEFGRLKNMKDATKKAELRTKLEEPVWSAAKSA
jgi:hypothetical protein